MTPAEIIQHKAETLVAIEAARNPEELQAVMRGSLGSTGWLLDETRSSKGTNPQDRDLPRHGACRSCRDEILLAFKAKKAALK